MIRPLASSWTTEAFLAELRSTSKYGARMLYVEWSEKQKSPTVELRSRVMTRDIAVDFSKTGSAADLTPHQRALFLAPTRYIPTDGIVKETAEKITAGATSDLEKARAIYEWVVENTFRDPKTIGCGTGDIRGMLVTGDLGGKCADINALYVGLARASGIPARDLYGIRVAPSRFGYKSLGANTDDITKAQHCRAEVHLTGYGWIPVDPADVRKVALEEPPGHLPMTDPKVVAARKALFGGWEMNWIAYNDAHDVKLPTSGEPPIAFLMYPQAKTDRGMCDCYNPAQFRYTIAAREIT
jgi:transglutaminase-like putative cysteine protease